jgi:hypothetical protein
MRRRRSPRFFPVSLPGSIVHHIPVKSRSGYAEARSDFGYRYIGRFEQSAYGFDLFSRELWRTAPLASTGASGFQTSHCSLADEIAFELSQRRKDVKNQLSGRRSALHQEVLSENAA